MNQQEIHNLIDNCILLNTKKKDFLKKNFCIYPKQKQERIILMLEKASQIKGTQEDFEIFSYGMKMWSQKKKIEALESEDNER